MKHLRGFILWFTQYVREEINLVRFNHWNKNILVTPRISRYVDYFVTSHERKILNNRRKHYEKMKRAVVQSESSQAHTIAMLIKATGAMKVLELGTFRGYTTAVLAEALPETGKIFTCETNPFFLRDGRMLWRDMSIEHKIEWFYGKGYGYMMSFDDSFFDCIFIDADKKDTQKYIDDGWKKLRSGGLMIVDNVLWRGLVADRSPLDTRAQELKKINEYVRIHYKDSVIIPAWDGLMMIVK